MSARVDATRASVLVWCTSCPSWAEFARDPERGHDLAVVHEQSIHPDSRQAEVNRHKFLARLGRHDAHS
jgi:hypothetical protein